MLRPPLSQRTPSSQTSATPAQCAGRCLTDRPSYRDMSLYTGGSPRLLTSVSSVRRVSRNKKSCCDTWTATKELTSTHVLTVAKFSTDPQSWRDTSARTQRNPRCLTSAHTAWKRSANWTNLFGTRGCTPERSPSRAPSAGKDSRSRVTAKRMKRHTRSSRRNLTAAPTAGCVSSRPRSSGDTSAPTQERNRSVAPCARAASPAPRGLNDTWGVTPGRDRTNASTVGRAFTLARI